MDQQSYIEINWIELSTSVISWQTSSTAETLQANSFLYYTPFVKKQSILQFDHENFFEDIYYCPVSSPLF